MKQFNVQGSRFKVFGIIILMVLALTGCSMLPSMSAGVRLAQEVSKNQQAFQEAVVNGSLSIDCAVGYTVGSRIAMTSNAKIDLAKANLLAVVDRESKEYKACYKFGLYTALTMHETEWTVQRLLEFIGTIN